MLIHWLSSGAGTPTSTTPPRAAAPQLPPAGTRVLTTNQRRRHFFIVVTEGSPAPTAAIVGQVPAIRRGLFKLLNLTAQTATIEVPGQCETAPQIAPLENRMPSCDGSDIRAAGIGAPDLGSASIDELLDVDISGIAAGQQRRWNGAALVPLTESGTTPNLRHQASGGGTVTIPSSVAIVNDTAWSTIVATWLPGRLELYVDGFSRASSTATATNTSALFGIYRWGWGFSTSQDFNGDIALIACFASSWTAAMVRRWRADPFGFPRPWGEVPALMGSAPPATPPSTGSGVVTFLMG
jgi:hypothetical protein